MIIRNLESMQHTIACAGRGKCINHKEQFLFFFVYFHYYFLVLYSVFYWRLGQGRVHTGLWMDRCSYATHVSFFQSYFLSAPTLLWTWTCHCSSDIFVRFAQNSFLNIAVKNFWKPSKGNRMLASLKFCVNALKTPIDEDLYISLRNFFPRSDIDGWLKMVMDVSDVGLWLKWWQQS